MIISTEGVGQSEQPERNTGKNDCKDKSYLFMFQPARSDLKGVFKGQFRFYKLKG